LTLSCQCRKIDTDESTAHSHLKMGFAATIMSKEEALTLPPKERPLCFRLPSKIYHDIFETVGSASLCWNPKPEGVFDTEQAGKFAVELGFKVAEELERLGITYEQINK